MTSSLLLTEVTGYGVKLDPNFGLAFVQRIAAAKILDTVQLSQRVNVAKWVKHLILVVIIFYSYTRSRMTLKELSAKCGKYMIDKEKWSATNYEAFWEVNRNDIVDRNDIVMTFQILLERKDDSTGTLIQAVNQQIVRSTLFFIKSPLFKLVKKI
jgi:hypothetical protein